jgi:hypothetical protein
VDVAGVTGLVVNFGVAFATFRRGFAGLRAGFAFLGARFSFGVGFGLARFACRAAGFATRFFVFALAIVITITKCAVCSSAGMHYHRRAMRNAALLVVVLASCGPDHGSLVRVDPEPAGENCPEGGVAVQTGRDDNGNGAVDDDEIESTSYVCGGASPLSCDDRHSISGLITIFDSAGFAQLDGVGCIDGDLVIAGIDAATLPELSLEIVTGGITLAGNPELTSLSGLGKITAVGGFYAVQGNGALTDISAIGKLREGPSVIISGNDSLLDLAGLETWIDVSHNLIVANNASLRDLHGLENLTSTTQGVLLRGNRNLVSVEALDNLRSAAALEISGDAALTSVSLASLQKINVTLLITTNDALATIEFPSLATTSGVQVLNNRTAVSASFPSLVFTNAFQVQFNPMLRTISAPTFIAATGTFDLSTLPSLTTLDVSALTSIGGALTLSGLSTLSSLSGFSSLGGISGDMTLQSCTALTNLSGLDQLERIGGNLTITANPNLPTSTAQAFATRVAIGGTTTIN